MIININKNKHLIKNPCLECNKLVLFSCIALLK